MHVVLSQGFQVGDPARPFLEPNTDYMFRCRSFHEDFGWSPSTDCIASEIVALPSTSPDRMAAPTLVLLAGCDRLTIAWQEPLENGAYIDAYQASYVGHFV